MIINGEQDLKGMSYEARHALKNMIALDTGRYLPDIVYVYYNIKHTLSMKRDGETISASNIDVNTATKEFIELMKPIILLSKKNGPKADTKDKQAKDNVKDKGGNKGNK